MSELALGFARTIRHSALAEAFGSSVRHHQWLIFLAVGYTAAAAFILEALGRDYQLFNTLYVFSASMPAICWLVFLGSGIVRAYLEHRGFDRDQILERLGETGVFSFRQVAYVVVPLVLLPPFSSAFSSFKSAITDLSPFTFDIAFMELDRWLHFGMHPWEILHPLVGHPLITASLNYLYNVWLIVFYIFLFVMVFRTSDLRLRLQYLSSFILLWIVCGSILATLFSSAGPCFFGAVTGVPDPYEPLLAYLRAADETLPVWALGTQQYLWDAYSTSRLATGGGISAMPSMHVAIAALQALAGWRLDRRIGIVLGIYAFLILVGSVHLAWHYAVDGYVSIVAAIVVWSLTGHLLRRVSSSGADAR